MYTRPFQEWLFPTRNMRVWAEGSVTPSGGTMITVPKEEEPTQGVTQGKKMHFKRRKYLAECGLRA